MFLSDVICLYVAIICQLYMKYYKEVLYYQSIAFNTDFFMILYQYIAMPLFWFCVLKPIGSMLQKKFQIKKFEIRKKLNVILLGSYVLFAILIENSVFYLSPLKFLIYAVFGGVGFVNGLYCKYRYES